MALFDEINKKIVYTYDEKRRKYIDDKFDKKNKYLSLFIILLKPL